MTGALVSYPEVYLNGLIQSPFIFQIDILRYFRIFRLSKNIFEYSYLLEIFMLGKIMSKEILRMRGLLPLMKNLGEKFSEQP